MADSKTHQERETALNWWSSLGNKAKDEYASQAYNRNYVSLTGREIQGIWEQLEYTGKIVAVVPKPVVVTFTQSHTVHIVQGHDSGAEYTTQVVLGQLMLINAPKIKDALLIRQDDILSIYNHKLYYSGIGNQYLQPTLVSHIEKLQEGDFGIYNWLDDNGEDNWRMGVCIKNEFGLFLYFEDGIKRTDKDGVIETHNYIPVSQGTLKVLVQPSQFRKTFLQAMESSHYTGLYKEGDMFLIECEPMYQSAGDNDKIAFNPFVVKNNSNGKVIIHRQEKKTYSQTEIELIENQSKLSLLVRLEAAIGRMKILHNNAWIEVDDYRTIVGNEIKVLKEKVGLSK